MVSYFPQHPGEYEEPTGYMNGDPVNGFKDMVMAGAILWEASRARRNLLAIPCNVPGVVSLAGTTLETIFRIPIPHTSQGQAIKVAVRYKTSSAAAGNEVYFVNGAELTLSTSYAWQVFTVPAAQVGDSFVFAFRSVVGGSNTLTVSCVCAYQEEDDTAPAWTDLSGATCKVGVADFPYSAHMLKRVCENVQHVRWRSMPRKVICCHWFREWKKFKTPGGDPAYGDGFRGLGAYYFVKPAGVSTIYVDMCFDCDSTALCTVRTEVSDSVEGSQTTADLAEDASGDALWLSHTYTFAGANITDELICEVKFDGLIQGAYYGWLYMPGVCVRPEAIAAAPAAMAPPFSVDTFGSGKSIAAVEFGYLARALQILRERMCLCHLVSDWRWDVSTWTGELTPQAAAYDKGDHGATASTIARCIAFPSTGAWRIRVAVGFKMLDGSTADNVTLLYSLSDSMTEATNDDTGPMPDGEWLVDAADYDDAESPVVIRDLKGELEIAGSADWETPAGALTRAGAVPLQVWVQSKTEAATAYLIPYYVIIQEDLLRTGDETPW